MMSRIVVVVLMCQFSVYTHSAVVKSSNTLLLKQWLSGEHHSTNDKIQDRDVQLALQILPIWQDRIDGEWLYMESSVINSPHKPFRQRILQLVDTPNNRIRLYSYSIPRASDFAGAYYEPQILSSLTLSQLTIHSGCELLIELKDTGIFVGESNAKTCVPRRMGLQFMATFFAVSEFNLSFLDRGYDKHGQLIQGSLENPVTFLKISPDLSAVIK
ncbi:MAG: CpeT protein [Moritella sp.]|jgi:CpeT protein